MSIYAEFITTGGSVSGTQTYGQKSIAIYDAATNLPVNGNNCVVAYQQNINGVITNGSVIIPGLSYPIYTGKLSDSNPSSYFTTTFTIVSVTPASTPPLPVADDLTLVAIVTTPASAIGASDGTVKIIATSSFPAISYSLDGVTWQSSPTFTGQAGGVGTGYAKDTNGGNVSGPYTVDFLGKLLVTDPSINLGNGNISRWNAAFNPVFFKFQRKDFEVTSVTLGVFGNISVAVQADLSGVTAANGSTPGDYVYINTTLYKGTYQVVSVSVGVLVLACPYTANDTLGFVNINSLKKAYSVQMIITYVDPISGNMNNLQCAFQPNTDGSINADLSYFLQTLLSPTDGSNYSAVNYRDMNLSASYTVKYAEQWTGGIVSWVTLPSPFYVVYAAKQLGDTWGGNLAQYVSFQNGFQPAKWLTDFAVPVYNPGMPFDLGFIFSEYMVGLSAFYNIQLLDINQNPLTNQPISNQYLLNEDGTYILNQDLSKFIIATYAAAGSGIVQHVGLNRLLLNFGLPSNAAYFRVTIQYTSGGTTYNLLQPLMVRVYNDSPDRMVYLRWIGLTGSWNYYTFGYNQAVGLDVSAGQTVKRFIFDWQNADTIEDFIGKGAAEKWQLFGENIPVSDIRGLQSIKYSPKVQIMTSALPAKWQTVLVATGSYTEYETMVNAYAVQMTIALPSKNVQVQ